MSELDLQALEEMGPVDFIILEWPHGRPNGEAAPLIVDLADRGIIRILDIAFITKDADGTVTAIDLENLPEDSAFREFEGAASGLMDHSDLQDAAEALEPGGSAAILIWENRWAAPVAVALRKSGGRLLDSGRIPVQAILASLDAVEATT